MNYNATLQYVKGKVYELKGLDSAFHVHQPDSELVAFYAPEHYNKELFVQLTSGEKLIFEQVSEEILNSLEPASANIDQQYQDLLDKGQLKRATDAALLPVDLQELVNIVCEMQNHITATNGLWATDLPDEFKDHPKYHLLWQIRFKLKDGKATSYESRS